tara:strand:+ start:9011 stop:11767 length:2757 start_codon:yes stop_codon:yes gene_type:complete
MSSFTGAVGELTVNTTNKSLHLHDGSTAGGIEFVRVDLSNSTGSWTLSDGTNTSAIVIGNDTLTVNGTTNQIDVLVGTDAVTLSTPDSGVTAASYGSSTAIPVVTVDAKGRVTGVTTASITAGAADTDELSEGSSNLYFTNARADARITAVLIDEDNFASNSATRLPSQQSVKAYVDTQILTKDNSDEMTEGSTNLYFTNARADARISNALKDEDNMASDSATHLPSQQSVKAYVDAQTTDETAEGSSNLYYTDARVSTRTDTILNHSNHTNVTVAKVGSELRLSAASSYGDSNVGSYLSSNGFATQTAIVAAITDSAPSTLDTLNELAAALGDDANFSATTATALGLRVSKTADTGAAIMPAGTTAQRPTGAAGHVRYNSDLEQIEAYTDAWVPLGGASTVNADTFTANGSTTAYALSQTVSSEDNLLVFIEGVFQQQDAYSIATASGTTTLTFSAAPSNTNTILVYSFASNIQGSNLNIDTMTGDGSDVTLSLSIAPVNENNTQVFIDGVYQNKSGYSISGSTLTFSTAPPNGSAVEVMTMTQTEVNVPVDGTITSAKLSGALTTPGALTVTGAFTSLGIDDNANATAITIDSSENVLVGGTSLNAASSVGFTAAGQIRQVFASGVANDSLFGAISGVSNGFQITQDTSNNQSYIFHNGGAASLKIDASGNVLVNTANAGASGLSLSNGSNLSFAEGANSSIANLFRQSSSAASFLGSGYRFSANANKAESSYASSWARTAIGVGYGAIKFYADAAATVAVGTDITPTERMRITEAGTVSMPYQPVISGARGSLGAVIGAQVIAFDQFYTQVGITYNTSTKRFTVPVAGIYRITMNPFFHTTYGASRVLIGVNTDSPSAANNRGHAYRETATYDTGSLNSVVSLAANDYVVFYLNSGGLYDASGDRFNNFTIAKIA